MISYVLEAAKKSEIFSRIHVSTESEEIIKVVSDIGLEPEFTRPEELSSDITPIMPVLRWVMEEYQRRNQMFDEIWLLYACNPFLDCKTLENAANEFAANERRNPLLSVMEYPVSPEWALKFDRKNLLIPIQPEKLKVRSQDLPKAFYDSASFAIFPPNRVLSSEEAGRYDDFIGFILPKYAAVDIDDEQDWKLAEMIYLSRN